MIPNGDPQFDRAALDRFFAPFAAPIEQLAARRNLALIKYFHEHPNWALCFQHPIAELAFGKLSLYKLPENALTLSAAVWIDDYDSFTRRLRMLPPASVPLDAAAITARAESMLNEVLDWTLDEHFIAHADYRQSWGSMSKPMFLAGQPEWPEPVRDRPS